MTETNAISRYIIEKSGRTELLGKTLNEKAFVGNSVGVIFDCF